MSGWLVWLSITIDIDPVAFELGPFAVHWYGIGYIAAFAVGLWFVLRYARERGLDEQIAWDIAPWAIVAGLAGGRLYYVVQNDPGEFLSNPVRIFEVWNGGMAYFGAVFAVAAVILFFAWRRRLPLLTMLDVGALFALMAQPIGRIGNIINGDILGPATDLPWGVVYAHPDSFAPDTVTAFHPAGAYELLANLVLIGLLFPLRHRFAPGWFAASYVAAYCASQLVVFLWRSEPVVAWGMQQAQWTALIVLVVEALVIAAFWYRGARPWPQGSTAGV
ncbi:MAG: prolipoprotein diacylglyceryl transferase [Dehalococcoidia bacterium]|nr:prolipoprotein diacylglyceryl transferase [Dehalococcoidia bacterium]